MAFAAPLIGVALGLGEIGTAVVGLGIGLGVSFLASKLTAKETKTTSTPNGQRVSLKIDTAATREYIVGRAGTAGSLVYWQLTGTDNKTLQMVIALADHECTALTSVWVNAVKRTIDASAYVSGFNNKLKCRFYSGTSTQAADAAVIAASDGRWTSGEQGKYVCYAVIEAEYDETVFAGGIPQFLFEVQGAKLYDPRFDTTAGGSGSQRWATPSTWAWSHNPAVVLYNVLRGIAPGGEPLIGLNVPAAAIRFSDYVAAANACDENITKKAGGVEDRYAINTVFSSSESNRSIVEAILGTMAGEAVEAGGIYRIMAGVTQSVVANITDDDLIVETPLVLEPKRPRTELTNAVAGSYSDPTRQYNPVPVPQRTSSADETTDGSIRLVQTLDLTAVTSRSQAQRALEVARKRARRQAIVKCTLRARWFVLEAGDWITLTSNRLGYSSQQFQIETITTHRDLTSDVVLREVDDQIDDWTASTDEIDDNQIIDLKSAGPSQTGISGVAVEVVTIVASGGAQRPGLHVTWMAVTDPTIINLAVEYRVQGDTTALSRTILDPTTGTYTFVDGVQGSVVYEVRLRPITRPERATSWSSWVATASSAPQHVVQVAAYAESVNPAGLPPAILSAQDRFELSLITTVDAALNGIPAQLDALKKQQQDHAEATIKGLLEGINAKAQVRVEKFERLTADTALASQITTLQAQVTVDVAAAIVAEQTARATADSALASQTTTLASTVAGQSSSISILSSSVNGITAKFAVATNSNGHVTGIVQLAQGATGLSQFTVAADAFQVALNGQTGGAAIPVFAIQLVNGSPQLALRGNLFADGAITARQLSVASLSALSADLGDVTAGVLRNPANSVRFELTNGKLYRTDNTFIMDMTNKIFRMEF